LRWRQPLAKSADRANGHKHYCIYRVHGYWPHAGNRERLVRNLTNEIQINCHVIGGFPEHEARILETPLDIRNDE